MNFFDRMTPDIVPGCTTVVGDFNSVTEAEDHQSSNLDAASTQLHGLLEQWQLVETPHSLGFTSQHPSICGR